MKIVILKYWYAVFIFLCLEANAQQQDKPVVIPIGQDAYRLWAQWPVLRIGDRAYMRSTYDRSGGNEGADGSHFLFMDGKDKNVTLDVIGRGVLYFVRFNHWHGSPWHFLIDGSDNIVKETATADPVNARMNSDAESFLPFKTFPEPLAYTWSTTKGADLIWVPMPFKRSLRIAYSRTHYGTGYYIYHLYANDDLSRPIYTWNIKQQPDKDVLQLINRAGTDIAPRDIKKLSGTIRLNGREKLLLAKIQSPSSVIRAFKLTLPLKKAIDLERLRLLVTWDDSRYFSIDAPLCLFFGAGTLYNREHHKYLVKGFPINIKYDYVNEKVELSCYYPMPFFKSAKFEITGINAGDIDIKISYEIRYEHWKFAPNQSSYFHATYKDFRNPEVGKDLTLLDTYGIEGHKEWAGNFVGTSFIFSHNGALGTLEGDPRFFFDDSKTPQAYGTGTEEWAGGGDYWGGQNMTLPFVGHPCGAVSKASAKNDKDMIESGYRFLLADMMPFGRRAVIRLEHGGEDLSTAHYETVTYWYGLPAPSLLKTDEVDVGNISSEKDHKYYSPEASQVINIISRFEWGIDTFPVNPSGMDPHEVARYQRKAGKEVYPAQQEDGRYTRGVSEFTVKLNPANYGVLIRRTLDYSFPNQKAKIYIANASKNANNSKWEYAGIWYLAGSNTCIYSNPKGELGKRLYHIETSDRRFRDDEFLVPAMLTKGRTSIKIKIKFVPSTQELYPGAPFPRKSAWSELRYEIYDYVMPAFFMK